MLIDYIFRAFGVIFNLFSLTVKKGEASLVKLEEKYSLTFKAYSFAFSMSWLIFILLVNVNWTYVLILRGFTLIFVAYSFSLLEEESYLNPSTNYELGSILFSCFLQSLHEISLFYYINKLEYYQILFFLVLPYILFIAFQKKHKIAPPILLLAVLIQSHEIMDLDIMVMLIASLAGFGGCLTQVNLKESAQYSQIFHQGCVLWTIGIISQCFTQQESQIDIIYIILIVFIGGILLSFGQYLLQRGEQLSYEDSWLLFSFIFIIILSFVVSALSWRSFLANLFTIAAITALIYK